MFEDIENKVCLVAGASCGIGKSVAKELAKKGAKVIMVSRNKARGKEAFEETRKISNNNTVEWMPADLCSIKSIHKLALSFKNKYSKLNILFNCAGDKIMKKYYTIDGFDGLFFSNYLGHFLLTNLLFEPCPGLTHTSQGEYFPLPLKMLVPLFYLLKETQTADE